MATLIPIKSPPSDLAKKLRAMADLAEAGRLTDIVMIYAEDGNFEFRIGTSKLQAIAMASMLDGPHFEIRAGHATMTA